MSNGVHMFTETLTKRVRRSALLDLLTGPHGVDRYTELVDPIWTRGDARARIVGVRRSTPRSVTLTLAPNRAFTGFRAGQHINLSVEIDGRRRTRPYSPANAEGDATIELTVGRHDGGLVSTYLFEHARPGMVVGLDSVGGDFTLPARPAGRILFVSGGSGITPVMSMLRTLRARGVHRRSRVHPLRPLGRGGLLSRRTRRHRAGHAQRDGAARLQPADGRYGPARPVRRRAPGRRDGRPAVRLRVRPAGAGRRGARRLPGRAIGELRPAGVRSRRRTVRRPSHLQRQRRGRHR